MSRYSPTVLPTANMGFADLLGGLEHGTDVTMGLDERLRKRKQDQEEAAQRTRSAQLAEAVGRLGAREQGIVAEPKVPPASTGTRLTPLGRTGYAYDPELAERGRKTALADYTARLVPTYAREGYGSPQERISGELALHPERKAAAVRAKESADAAATRAGAQQRSATEYRRLYPDIPANLSDDQVVKLGYSRETKDYGNAHPAPARPRAGGTGPGSTGTRLDRDRDAAQRYLQSLQTKPEAAAGVNHQAGQKLPPGVTEASYQEWQRNYRAALARLRTAQAAVDSSLGRRAPARVPLPALPPLPD